MRTFEYPKGYVGNLHQHREAQLVYPIRGIVSVTTERGEWLATRFRGVCIPAWQQHRVSAEGNTLLHSLFVNADPNDGALTKLTNINITSLLHELIAEAGRFYVDYGADSTEARTIQLILDLTDKQHTEEPAWLPEIRNPRIRRAIEGAPLATLKSAAIAKNSAYSQRQFSRVFFADTGMAFKDWRALYRVHTGLRLLATGASVSNITAELGYSSASAFIAVFKKHTGLTPTALRI